MIETPTINGKRKPPAAGIYLAIVRAVDRRIRTLGWTMEDCDTRAGLPDRYVAKAPHPNTASGRQASWQSLQCLIGALYPNGVRVRLEPLPITDARQLERLRKQEPLRKFGGCDRRKFDLLEFSRRGGIAGAKARNEKLTPQRRSAIARKAARARQAKLTPQERAEIARDAARARWQQHPSGAP